MVFKDCTTVNDKTNFTNYSVSSTEEYFKYESMSYDSQLMSFKLINNLINFSNYVLGKSNGLEELQTVRWRLVLALLASWIIVVAALIKGIKSSGIVKEIFNITFFHEIRKFLV